MDCPSTSNRNRLLVTAFGLWGYISEAARDSAERPMTAKAAEIRTVRTSLNLQYFMAVTERLLPVALSLEKEYKQVLPTKLIFLLYGDSKIGVFCASKSWWQTGDGHPGHFL